MNPRIRRASAAALAAAVLTALAACSNSDSDSGSDKPQKKGPSTEQLVSKAAQDYMHAWMAVKPADAKTMCELSTKASRPNFDEDGGTLAGCVKERKTIGAEDTDTTRAPLDIKISNVQDVPASDTHPAGKGALATMHRSGEDQFRYAVRLVKEGDKWLIEQTSDVGDRFAHTADPVAPVLAGTD
ncbi:MULTISPECIES: hypothetical protein [Streptomyces]|uniref:Lipoprotein n=1 Tax=Streptomyces zinciresistens K42 TaxID=700597 RepID=G2GDE1_9ACTN|nr:MULTISPECIES: hypothetical protein [Streptomyces]EGX58473.1 hypothetical protein SZN_17592 [Streptomyces zinciresistens K42]MDT9695829.1 hypothetical protein [Streptomyces sp. P17]